MSDALERRNAIVGIPTQDSQLAGTMLEAMFLASPRADIMPIFQSMFGNGAYLTTVGIPTGRSYGIHREVRPFTETRNVLVPAVIFGNINDPTVIDRVDADIAKIGNVLKGRKDGGQYLPSDSRLFHFLFADGRQDAVSSIKLDGDSEKTKFHGEAIDTQILVRHLKYMGYSDGVVTLDFHSLRGVKDFQVENLPHANITAAVKLVEWIRSNKDYTSSNPDNVIAACDYGDLTRSFELSKRTGFPIEAIIQKTRRDDVLEAALDVANVAGKRVFVWDDIIDKAGTLVTNADLLIDEGHASEVIFMATYPVFTGKYKENIAQVKQEHGDRVKIVVTNALTVTADRMPEGIEEVIDISEIAGNTAKILLEAESFEEVKERLTALNYIHKLEAPDDVAEKIKAEIDSFQSEPQAAVPSVTTFISPP